MEQVYTPTKDYKVLVNCMTYNQSKYIEDALNGFAMQKTDFPFVSLVMDDASTDGEQDVIKAWMERECDMAKAENVEIEKSFITIVPHKTNEPCTFAFYFLKQNLFKTDEKTPLITPWRERCEYEAICEGDDHWIDNTKLQHQVIFLDQNSDYGMVFTRSIYLKTDGSSRIYGTGYNSFRDMLLYGNTIPTATVCYRKEYSDLYRQNETIQRECQKKQWMLGDYPFWVFIGSKTKVHCLPEVTSCYLCLEESASHSADINKEIAFLVSSKDIKDFLIDLFFPNDVFLRMQSDRMFAWGIYRKYMLNNMPVEAYQFLSGYYYCLKFRMKFISKLMHNCILKNIILSIWKKQ